MNSVSIYVFADATFTKPNNVYKLQTYEQKMGNISFISRTGIAMNRGTHDDFPLCITLSICITVLTVH